MKTNLTRMMFVAAMLGALLFAACSDLINSPQNAGSAAGTGRVRVSINGVAGTAAARTAYPDNPGVDSLYYTYSFAKDSGAAEEKEPVNGTTFTLPVGIYTLTVKAYLEAGYINLVGSGSSGAFTISAGVNTSVTITLNPVETEGEGTFRYTITYPAGTLDSFTLTSYIAGTAIDLTAGLTTGENTKPVAAGYYTLTAALTDSAGKTAGKTEAVHIYKNMTTRVTWDFTADDYFTTKLGGSTVTINLWENQDDPTLSSSVSSASLFRPLLETAMITAPAGSAEYRWTENGSLIAGETGNAYTFASALRGLGVYNIGLQVKKTAGDVWYSAIIPITVTGPVSLGGLGANPTSNQIRDAIAAVVPYLSGAGTAAAPKLVPISGYAIPGTDSLTALLTGVSNGVGSSLYFSLDLSACTVQGTGFIQGNGSGQSALKDKVISIILPASLTAIGNYAFLSCPSLTTLTFKGDTPPTLPINAIFSSPGSVLEHIYIPADSVDAYKTRFTASGKSGLVSASE